MGVERRVYHVKTPNENTLVKFYMDKTRKSPNRIHQSPEKVRQEANEDLALLNAEAAINLHYSPLKPRPDSSFEKAPTGAVLPKTTVDKKPSTAFERMMEVRRREEQ